MGEVFVQGLRAGGIRPNNAAVLCVRAENPRVSYNNQNEPRGRRLAAGRIQRCLLNTVTHLAVVKVCLYVLRRFSPKHRGGRDTRRGSDWMTMRMKWKEICKTCLPVTSEQGCDFQWDNHAHTRLNKRHQLMWIILVNYSVLYTDI